MEFIVVAVSVVLWALSIFLTKNYYKAKKPESMSKLKPKLKFFPKYVLVISIPNSILDASDSLSQLERFMESLGFEEVERFCNQVLYSRGKWIGDFSTRYAKLDLVFSRPLQSSTNLEVSYGAFAIFDTGALWNFCTELSNQFDTAA